MADAPTRRVFYWGSRRLGYRCLARLVEYARAHGRVELAGVCVSARHAGKGSDWPTRIADLARRVRVPVFTERDELTVSADVGLAVGYPHRIPPAHLDRCRDGAVNLHLGPLPYYRGSKTLTHAILNGETEFGASLHYMDADLDTGDVVYVRWIELPDDRTAAQVTRQLTGVGYRLVDEYLPAIVGPGRLEAVPQAKLVAAAGVEPRYYTRDSIAPLFRLSKDWDFDVLYRYTRALTTGDGRAPYLEHRGRRLYLSLHPPPPDPDD